MLIISGGMPKSGSALCFNLINEILISNGYSDTRKIREEYNLQDVILADDCFIMKLDREILLRLSKPIEDGHSFVIKTHNFPKDDFFKSLEKENIEAKFIYTLRDPRDALLSGMDHYKKDTTSFRGYDTFERALPSTNRKMIEAAKWYDFNFKLLLKYEKFTLDIYKTLENISEYLNLLNQSDFVNIEKNYSKDSYSSWNNKAKNFSRLHFNKAQAGRYLKEFNKEEIQIINDSFSGYLKKFGYLL